MAVRPLRSLRSPSLEIPVRAGSVVVRQGEPLPPMRAVVDGAFVVEVLGHDGRRLLLDVLGPVGRFGPPQPLRLVSISMPIDEGNPTPIALVRNACTYDSSS